MSLKEYLLSQKAPKKYNNPIINIPFHEISGVQAEIGRELGRKLVGIVELGGLRKLGRKLG